jgi:hypothetical protein
MSLVVVRFALAAALLAGGPGAARAEEPGWEKLFDVGRGAWLAAVYAEGDQWFAGGKEVLVKGGPVGATAEPRPGKTILGLKGGPAGLLALGADQLILRFDGKTWVQEHFTAPPARPTPRTSYASVLHSSNTLGASGPLVAYGPRAVLVRQPDGRWTAPAEPERERLSRLAQQGPRGHVPPRCAPYGWFWLPGDRGLLTCHGGRTFVIEKDRDQAAGTLPRSCADSGEALAERARALYMLCAGHLWRSGEGRWTAVAAPSDLRAVAATPRCLFVASDRSVWKSCAPAPSPTPRRARSSPRR